MLLLVATPDARLGRMLRAVLETDGYAVDVTDHLSEALWYAGESPYAVIVLDQELDGELGGEPDRQPRSACEALRRAGVTTPVLMLGMREPCWASQVRGLDDGADAYLDHPVGPALLLARLRSLQRRTTPAPRPVVLVGGLSVDLDACQVSVAGNVLDLTAQERSLLVFLARHQGTAVSRRLIMTEVWASPDRRDFNVVEVLVSRLRRKSGHLRGGVAIETVRGLGYRMVPA